MDIGSLVTTNKPWVELCLGCNLYEPVGEFRPTQVGTVVMRVPFHQWTAVRILTQGGVLGWVAEQHLEEVL